MDFCFNFYSIIFSYFPLGVCLYFVFFLKNDALGLIYENFIHVKLLAILCNEMEFSGRKLMRKYSLICDFKIGISSKCLGECVGVCHAFVCVYHQI